MKPRWTLGGESIGHPSTRYKHIIQYMLHARYDTEFVSFNSIEVTAPCISAVQTKFDFLWKIITVSVRAGFRLEKN
jgi:hypothetical protein